MSETTVEKFPVEDGMQVLEIIKEISSTHDEGAVNTDDILLVHEETGEVFIPREVVYDSANDAVVIKIANADV